MQSNIPKEVSSQSNIPKVVSSNETYRIIKKTCRAAHSSGREIFEESVIVMHDIRFDLEKCRDP